MNNRRINIAKARLNPKCNFSNHCFTRTIICKHCTRNVIATDPLYDLYEDLSYIVQPLIDLDSCEYCGILKYKEEQ